MWAVTLFNVLIDLFLRHYVLGGEVDWNQGGWMLQVVFKRVDVLMWAVTLFKV